MHNGRYHHSKLKFEREAMGAGVPAKSYSIDNGIYTSKDFTRELNVKVQVISQSGVGGHHHNGVAENTINNLVRISRNMSIRDALKWPDSRENIL